MIVEYHRPSTLAEALDLLARLSPVTVPMGGGSLLNQPSLEPVAVVDLQALGLDRITRRGNVLEVGAAVTLQSLVNAIAGNGAVTGDNYPWQAALCRAILHEATANLRNVATLAGTLIAAGGRSPAATALLALDARLALLPAGPPAPDATGETPAEVSSQAEVSSAEISLGDLLPLRAARLRGRLITHILLSLNVRLAYDYVARTPADQPIVCAAAAQWPSGRTRVALGGFGEAPILALDGPEPAGAETAAGDAASGAGDAWASAEYRQDVAEILTRRCIQALQNGE